MSIFTKLTLPSGAASASAFPILRSAVPVPLTGSAVSTFCMCCDSDRSTIVVESNRLGNGVDIDEVRLVVLKVDFRFRDGNQLRASGSQGELGPRILTVRLHLNVGVRVICKLVGIRIVKENDTFCRCIDPGCFHRGIGVLVFLFRYLDNDFVS